MDSLETLDSWQFNRLAREVVRVGTEKISGSDGIPAGLIFLQDVRDAVVDAESLITGKKRSDLALKDKADQYFRQSEARSRR